MAKRKLLNLSFLVAALAFVFVGNFYFNDYSLSLFSSIAIFIILAASYNLINGVTGQFSLEPNGFVAVGAYTAAILLLNADEKTFQFVVEDPSPLVLALYLNNFFIVMILSGLAAVCLSLILAFPVFRVKGDYLAIVTLGFGQIIQIFAVNFPSYTNGSIGLSNILINEDLPDGDFVISKYTNFMYTGVVSIICVLLILGLIYSKYGRAMKAIRDDEDAAQAVGINTFKIKTLAFASSAFFEGLGGALLVAFLGSVSPEQFNFFFTFQLLIIIVLGGLGSTTGAIIGSILVIGGSEWLRFLDEPFSIFGFENPGLVGLRLVVFSLILIVVMIFAREGIMGRRELSDVIFKYFCKRSSK